VFQVINVAYWLAVWMLQWTMMNEVKRTAELDIYVKFFEIDNPHSLWTTVVSAVQYIEMKKEIENYAFRSRRHHIPL
jgi:hypothetical protein